jgi:hypothetical protein
MLVLIIWHIVSALCVRIAQDVSPIAIMFNNREHMKWIILVDLVVSVITFHHHPLNAAVAWLLAVAFYKPFSESENSIYMSFILLMVRTEGIFLIYDPFLIVSLITAGICVYVSVFSPTETCWTKDSSVLISDNLESIVV